MRDKNDLQSFVVRVQTSDGCDFTTTLQARNVGHLRLVLEEQFPEMTAYQIVERLTAIGG